MPALLSLLSWIGHRVDVSDEEGFSTAELLGNAALGVAALVVIWAGLSQLGVDLIAQMRGALGL